MMLRPAIAPGFPVKIPVFDVTTDRQAHVGIGRQLLAGGPLGGRPAEMENRRVRAGQHPGAQFNFNRPPVTSIGDELPDGGRAGVKRREVFCVKRRKETIGIHPNANAFDKDMPVHRHGRMQVRTEHAVIFGLYAAQIHAHPRHAADAVGQQDQIVGVRSVHPPSR
jgi:hypothetical protein